MSYTQASIYNIREIKGNYITKLEILPGELILLNNNFWLHGREPFKKNKKLKRELLRQRGIFYKTT